RATVTNLLRLFELNEDVRELLRGNKLSLGHAKALPGVAGPRQSSLAGLVVSRQYSVRQAEELVRAALASRPGRPHKAARSAAETELTARIGMPVRIQQNPHGAGRLSIRFRQKSELDKLLKLLR
ncbi:MAG: chromosome partitioning protein ParB, partial [Hydrocarboniphaga effusa]|nr:chromosome partitioning protein ParB [Hydrocarboniphaga effusa]